MTNDYTTECRRGRRAARLALTRLTQDRSVPAFATALRAGIAEPGGFCAGFCAEVAELAGCGIIATVIGCDVDVANSRRPDPARRARLLRLHDARRTRYALPHQHRRGAQC
jgi:hypothetical protein